MIARNSGPREPSSLLPTPDWDREYSTRWLRLQQGGLFDRLFFLSITLFFFVAMELCSFAGGRSFFLGTSRIEHSNRGPQPFGRGERLGKSCRWYFCCTERSGCFLVREIGCETQIGVSLGVGDRCSASNISIHQFCQNTRKFVQFMPTSRVVVFRSVVGGMGIS